MIKLMQILFVLFVLIGCNKGTSVVEVVKGDNGKDGKDGANGHSLVSQFVQLDNNSLECSNAGTRLDIYLDLDDTFTVSSNDSYVGSLIACAGLNGLNGINGLDGTDGQDGIPGVQGPQGEVGPQGVTGPQGEAGPVGPIGPQGPQGATGAVGPSGSGATITVYNSNACVNIADTMYYVKTTAIYDNATCSSSHKLIDLNTNNGTFWVGVNKLATPNSNNGIKVILFN